MSNTTEQRDKRLKTTPPYEQYPYIFSVQERAQISLSNSTIYKLFFSINIHKTCMTGLVLMSENVAGSDPIFADILDLKWLDSNHIRDMRDIWGAQETSFNTSVCILLYLCMSELQAIVRFAVM